MPAASTSFKNKQITLAACSHDGQFVWPESQGIGSYGAGVPGGGGNYKLNSFAQFTFCTGGVNGYIADVSPAVSATQNLVNPQRCPLNMRPYLTRLDVCVLGTVNWSNTSPTSVPFLSIQDTLGTPLVHIPWSALKGNACLTFPDSDVYAPLILGPSATTTPFGTPPTTWTFSGGVITAGAALFGTLTSPTQMVGTPVEIVGGTGVGQTGVVTAASASTLTINCNWGTYGTTVAPDATSMLALYWQPLSSYTSTTVMTLENASGTTYTANIYDNGFNLLGIAGAGAGSSRTIASSTNAGQLTLAFALNNAMAVTSSIVAITNEPNMDGSVDLVCDDKLSTAQLNTGLQAVVSSGGGTSPVGSIARIYGEGYWAA